MEVRLRARDGAGRLLEVKLNSGRRMVTPTFFPVYNPNIPLITPGEIKQLFRWNEIITNAYIIWRNRKLSATAEEKGVHGLLDFDGIVMMDSGAYQMWLYGRLEVSNEEIIEFQNKILPDIATFHDVIIPHGASRHETEKGVKETLVNAEVCSEMGDERITWLATVQGAGYDDLVRLSAERLRELNFDYYAVGSLVDKTVEWNFEPMVDYSVTALSIIPRSKPVHGWGVGHPAVFSLLVLLGIDTFDSASYALYARDNRLMFPWGTERLENLEEIPYTHALLEKYTVKELIELPKEERTKLLAIHNLNVIFNEIKAIRQAIRGEYLFEYVQERVRVHPGLHKAFLRLLEKHGRYLEEFTPFTKKHGLFIVGPEFKYRPEVKRARKRISKNYLGRKRPLDPYGDVPETLLYTYPFGQTHPGWDEKPSVDPKLQAHDVILYTWGVSLDINKIDVEVRRGRARKVYYEGKYIGVIRPHDGVFVPSIEGARLIKNMLSFPEGRVVVDDVASEPVSQGKTVFTKFVLDIDTSLRPNQEVIVVDSEDNVLAVGKLVLSPKEIEEFSSHPAVKVRHGARELDATG